jgi:hypothetical protein
MKTSPVILTASVAALAFTLTATRDAHALGPVDLEVAAKVGYATPPGGSIPGAPNPLGLGLGARGGVSFFGIYGGLNFQYYLGGSEGSGSQSASIHAVQFGGEVGYGFKISFLTIRPQIGFGDMTFSGSAVTNSSGDLSTGSFYLEPGGLVQFSFGHLIFGVDAGCLILTNQDTVGNGPNAAVGKSFTIHGQIGARF